MALPNPTALPANVDYAVFNTRTYTWVPTIATPSAPTLSELSAGTDLTKQINSVSGFTTTTASLDTPRAGTNFTGNIPGRKTAADSSLTFYVTQTGTDVRSVLTENLTGFIVIYNEGIVTGGHISIWPVRIGSVAVQNDIEAVAMAEIQFYITSNPTQGVAIPTS